MLFATFSLVATLDHIHQSHLMSNVASITTPGGSQWWILIMQPCWCVKTRTAGASPPQVLTRRGWSAGAGWAGEVNLYVKDPLCPLYATPLGLPPLAPAARCNLLVVILACTLMNSGSEGMAIGGGGATLCNRGSSRQASKTKFIGSKLEARFFLLCFFIACVCRCGKLCLNCEGAVLSKLWNCGVTIFTFFMILFFVRWWLNSGIDGRFYAPSSLPGDRFLMTVPLPQCRAGWFCCFFS